MLSDDITGALCHCKIEDEYTEKEVGNSRIESCTTNDGTVDKKVLHLLSSLSPEHGIKHVGRAFHFEGNETETKQFCKSYLEQELKK